MAPSRDQKAEFCVLYGEELGEYGFPDPHPFSRRRLPAFWTEFISRGLKERVPIESPEMCDETALEAFHTRAYIDFVKRASASGAGYLDYGDTPAFKGVFEAASRVVGTTLKALRLVVEGKYKRTFCPLGGLHHARRDRAGGFCVFNDIGVAIEQLRRIYGIRRIGYVDIDAHHGDGVFYEFESDAEVFIADIHEDGRFLYPGTGFSHETGSGEAQGTKLNLPMPPGASDDHFMRAFSEVEAFLESRRPDIILFQCGADSTARDPIAGLEFSPHCHAYAAKRLRALAEKHARGRLLAMGGGGYDLSNIAATWCAVVEALI
ncbi:MAG TPA: acetoin utilization protein AcuC [Candidatus Acidoferrales bacterium]|nr:acetoin utilization protein AcuC [Candidatus Acidoferrales bacterium]